MSSSPPSPPPATIVVITGATHGLGYHATAALAARRPPPRVYLACRNTAAAAAAADALAARTGCDRGALVVLPQACDLADLASVRAYAAAVRADLGDARVTALIANAGVGGTPAHTTTADGYDAIFATNHLGHAVLTLCLLPALARGGRVVTVASEVHDPANKTGLPDPTAGWPTTDADYDAVLARGDALPGEGAATAGLRRYARSKLCNVLATQELARRLTGAPPPGAAPGVVDRYPTLDGTVGCRLPAAASVRCVAVNPGLMLDSNFFSASLGAVAGRAVAVLAPVLRLVPRLRRFMRTAPESGAVLARVALGEVAPDADAAYISDGAPCPASAFARSVEGACGAQQDVWRHTLRWGRVTRDELAEAGFV